jgi:hypothetical protein
MEILVNRDIIQDELGNYYIVSKIEGNRLTLVNAVVYYSFNRILREDFLREVNSQYDKPVAVGQFFTDLVKNKISRLKEGKTPGSIYMLNDVRKKYEINVDSLYERSVSVN